MNTITNLNTFPIGNSLDGVNIITEEINTLSLLVDGTNSMLADLNMNNHIIKNMEAGVDSLDAVNKSQLDTKADTSYVNTQDNLRVLKSGDTMTGTLNMNTANKIINIANGTNNGDAVNRGQLNTKADTSYVNTQLALKANITYVDTQLALKANTTYVDTQLALKSDKTYVDSQLALKSDTIYVNSQLALKADTTYVDAQDNLRLKRDGTDVMTGFLNMNTANKIINLANGTNTGDAINKGQLDFKADTTYVNTQDANLKTYTDSSLNTLKNYVNTQSYNSNYVLRNGNLAMTGILDMNTTNRIRNVADPLFNQDVVTKNYSDTQDTNLKNYVNSQDTSIRNDVNTALNLKLNKSGDTMSGDLTINAVLNLNAGNVSSTSVDPDNGTNTYINFGYAGTGSDWAYLRQIGSSNDIHLSLDFHDDSNDGKFSLRNIVSTDNPDTIKPFFTSTPTTTIINYPSASTNIDKQLALIVNNNYNNGLFFHNNLTGGSWNGLVAGNDKAIIFSDGTSGTGNLVIGNWGNAGLKIIGSSGNIGIGTATPSEKLEVIGNVKVDGYVNSNTQFKMINPTSTERDRLYIADNSGGFFFFNEEGILGRFIPGTVKWSIDREGNGSFKNISRSAWNSGDVIQTKIYNQTTSGSGIATIAAGVNTDWKTINFTAKNNNLSDTILCVKVDFPYLLEGSDMDAIEIKIVDTTGSSQTLMYKSQYYNGSGGGGTRSGTIGPLIASYTPTEALTTLTRTLKVQIKNNANDNLFIGIGMTKSGSSFVTINMDYYTIEITEIKK